MNQNNGRFAGPFVMLFSAAIFGFFGFSRDWNAPFPDGKVVLFMVVLGWTLKISAAMFVISGVLSIVKPIAGHLLYALTGVAAAGLFLVVVVMDVTDTTTGWTATWGGSGGRAYATRVTTRAATAAMRIVVGLFMVDSFRLIPSSPARSADR